MEEQQEQARSFFRASAADWQQKAEGKKPKFNVIQGRNQVVMRVLNEMESPGVFLDAGCGTGQLVLSAVSSGIQSVGVDFADEMIAICRNNAGEQKLEAEFVHASIFDYLESCDELGSVSAMGLIEYLPLVETDQFFGAALARLRAGGRLLVGSRNRLFNMRSFNAFTSMERDLGMLDGLMDQCLAMMESESQEMAVQTLDMLAGEPEPQPVTHPHTTGIQVEARFQFSPADLLGRLHRAGFKVRRIHPVHFHGLPLFLKDSHPGAHVELAGLAESLAPGDHRLVPFSSTFVMEAEKPA